MYELNLTVFDRLSSGYEMPTLVESNHDAECGEEAATRVETIELDEQVSSSTDPGDSGYARHANLTCNQLAQALLVPVMVDNVNLMLCST